VSIEQVNAKSLSVEASPPAMFWAVIVFLVSGLIYLSMPQPVNSNAGDNLWYVPTAMSLVRDRTLDISSFGPAVRAADADTVWIDCIDVDPRLVRVVRPDGTIQRVNRYPIGPALFAIPFVVADNALFKTSESPFQRAQMLAVFVAAVSAAIAVALMFLVARCLTPEPWLIWSTTLIYAFASPHFGTHHSELWSNNVLQVFVLVALIALAYRDGELSWLGAIPLALAYVTRPDSALFIGACSTMVVVFSKRRLLFVALMVLAAACFVLWSRMVFGANLPPYYTFLQATRFAPYREALVGVLFSPSRGLFVFSPILVLCVHGAGLVLARWRRAERVYLLAAVVVAGYWVLLGAVPWWWGGFSVGPRLFAPVLPLIMILMIPSIRAVVDMSGAMKTAAVAFVTVALAWSVFVEVRLGVSAGPYEWNYNPNIDTHREQLWNWSDLQILRKPAASGQPLLPKVPNCPSLDRQ